MKGYFKVRQDSLMFHVVSNLSSETEDVSDFLK